MDWTSDMVGLLKPWLSEGVEENDGALVEDCGSLGESPTRLNNLPE